MFRSDFTVLVIAATTGIPSAPLPCASPATGPPGDCLTEPSEQLSEGSFLITPLSSGGSRGSRDEGLEVSKWERQDLHPGQRDFRVGLE